MGPSPTYEDDAALWRGIQKEEPEAFQQLYRRYGKLLMGVIYRIVQDQAQSEEVLQDVMLKFWRQPELYRPAQAALSSWMIQVARNAAIDRWRSIKRRQQHYEAAAASENQAAEESTFEESEALQKMLAHLGKEQRFVLDKIYFEGYTQQELADRYQIPLGTVKSRLRLALNKLREMMKS